LWKTPRQEFQVILRLNNDVLNTTGWAKVNPLSGPLENDAQRFLITLLYNTYRETQRWPNWQFVLHSLGKEGLEAADIMESLPVLGRKQGVYGFSYGLTWSQASLGMRPQLGHRVGLTVAGFHQVGAEPYVNLFLDILNLACKKVIDFVPLPEQVIPIDLTSTELIVALERENEQPPLLAAPALFELLEHEPSMLGDGWSSSPDGNWKWALNREILRYAGVQTIEKYLEVVSEVAEESAKQVAQMLSFVGAQSSSAYEDDSVGLEPAEAFIIMALGRPDMESVCEQVLIPAIRSTGMRPTRVDKDDKGELLKVEIIDSIERAQIIVADLTYERPNCYLEVGYAMGFGKKKHLILTVRKDHHHSSPRYDQDGPRLHFDLEGYQLLLWDPDDLPAFREELERRIKRRLAVLRPASVVPANNVSPPPTPILDNSWIAEQHERGLEGLWGVERTGYMEAAVALSPKGFWSQATLLSTVRESQIRTFGWPIGVIDRDLHRPNPRPDGVRAEIALKASENAVGSTHYDYWYFQQKGDFYMLQSLFEDERIPNSIFFDTRIVRVTELLLFLSRCYTRLAISDSTEVEIKLTHGGLAGRIMRSAGGRRGFDVGITEENEITTTTRCTVAELQSRLTENVKALLAPLFMLFNFFEPSDGTWDEIIDGFVSGQVV
jgi:hypothetical protein